MKTLEQQRLEQKQKRIQRETAAKKAQALWDNPIFQDAIQDLQEEALQVLDKAPLFGKVTKRQAQAIMYRQATNRLLKKLRKAVDDAALIRESDS